MSLLMLFALPNFLTASSPTALELLTAEGARFGLLSKLFSHEDVDFEALLATFSFRS